MMDWPQTGIGTAIKYHCTVTLENNVRMTSKHAKHNKAKIQQALSELENGLKEEMQKTYFYWRVKD